MSSIPVSRDLVEDSLKRTGLKSAGKASIREIVQLVNKLEYHTGIRYVRMEMGVPGLPCPQIAIEAETAALNAGVASDYPNILGIPELKKEASRFVSLFLDVSIDPEGCIPTVGSMMGSMIGFLVANRNDHSKEGTLFIDPGFPVQKQQLRMLGQNFWTFDVYNHRGSKLKDKLESYLATGKVSSLLYSNPNNPTWICLTPQELEVIGELCRKYDVIVMEDLAYFGMDFRKDYSIPGEAPFQPTVAHYTDDYMLLISSSKIFSYAGQRIGIMAVSDHLYRRTYPDLLRYYSTDVFGHAAVFGALYGLSAGVAHSVQYGFAALLRAVNDGSYRYRDEIKDYGEKAGIMKDLFLANGFKITYEKDLDENIADGFYFTVSYPGMTGTILLEELLYYGISAISLDITGSEREGLRACVSMVQRDQFSDLGERLAKFREDHPLS